MAAGRKTGGRDFKKGHPGGPGRPPIDPETKAARHLNHATVTAAIQRYYNLSLAELQALFVSKDTPSGDLMIISVMIKAIKEGDYKRLDMLLNRSCGRVKQTLEHAGVDGKPIEFSALTPEEKKARMSQIFNQIKDIDG